MGFAKTADLVISLELQKRLFWGWTGAVAPELLHRREVGTCRSSGAIMAAPKSLSEQALYKPDLMNKKQTKAHAKDAGHSADVAVKTPEAVC